MIALLSRAIPLLLCGPWVCSCSTGMATKFDAAWETVDPMGHRSEHQARHYPRGRSTGIRLPDGVGDGYPLPGSSR